MPVLLPFDTADYLEDQADGAPCCRCRATRPISVPRTCSTPARPATTRCFRCCPARAAGLPPRTFARPVEVQITGSILSTTSPIRSAARASRSRRWRRSSPTCAASSVKAMCATPSRASACPMWCRSSASTRRHGRGGWPAARPIRSPSVSSKRLRIAGGQPARPRRDIPSEIVERPLAASPDFTYRPSGDIIARSGVRKRGGRADFAAYSQIRFPLEKAPAAIRSQSFGKQTRSDERSIRGRTIFAKPAASRSGNAPPASAIRARTSAPRPARRTAKSDEQLRSAAAGRRRRPRRHPDPFTEAAGGNAADQHPQRAHPLSLHAHEPVSDGCRRRSQRTARRRGREDRRGLELSRPSQRHHRATCISTCRCSRATAGSGSIPTPP